YLAEIVIYCNNRTGLLVDFTKVFTERKIDVQSVNSRTSKQGIATIAMSFEVPGKDTLNYLIERIRQIESVVDIERTTG
ncbi:MAG: ACT domain-containing protein, partial [Lachnospiraceae bacterium]|nr:ACT domain-containing protein [Lachnospiraceae bacterium]